MNTFICLLISLIPGVLQEELKATKRQRIRDIMKHPNQEELLEQTYDEIEAELQKKIEGLSNQIILLADKRNTIIRVNRAAKTALEIMQDILSKLALERSDLELIIRKIDVFEDHLDIHLRPEVETILCCGEMEKAVNFESDSMDILKTELVQSSNKRKDKVYAVNVISGGDPLHTTLTPIDKFCMAIHSLVQRITAE